MFQVGQALGQVGQALGQVPVSSPGPELPLAFPCEQQPAQEEVHHHDEELDLFQMMSILVFQGCCLSFPYMMLVMMVMMKEFLDKFKRKR